MRGGEIQEKRKGHAMEQYPDRFTLAGNLLERPERMKRASILRWSVSQEKKEDQRGRGGGPGLVMQGKVGTLR